MQLLLKGDGRGEEEGGKEEGGKWERKKMRAKAPTFSKSPARFVRFCFSYLRELRKSCLSGFSLLLIYSFLLLLHFNLTLSSLLLGTLTLDSLIRRIRGCGAGAGAGAGPELSDSRATIATRVET